MRFTSCKRLESRRGKGEFSSGQAPFQNDSADDRQDKLGGKQGAGRDEPTPFHPPATQRRNEQAGCAGQKPCADKVQPLHREEETDSGKEEKAADEEERQ